VARQSQSSLHTSDRQNAGGSKPLRAAGQPDGIHRYVVVPTDKRRKVILCTGAYLWDGVTPWEPPEHGVLMLEHEALDAGYRYPESTD
jgi:hypothetical protein